MKIFVGDGANQGVSNYHVYTNPVGIIVTLCILALVGYIIYLCVRALNIYIRKNS